MELRVVDLGFLDGVVRGARLSGGVLWDGRALVAIGKDGPRWSLPVGGDPRWAAHGRRLYLAQDDTLSCVDKATGAPVWSMRLDRRITALAACPGGVEVLAGGRVYSVSRHGEVDEQPAPGREPRDIVRVGNMRWIEADDGLWCFDGTKPARRAYGGAVRGLVARAAGIEALVGADGLFREDQGLPMVWGFFRPEDVVLLPYGEADWVACDRATGQNLRIVDARRRTLWAWEGPPVRDVVVAGGRLVVEALDDVPTIGVIGPDHPPLWITMDAPIDALVGDGDLLLIAHTPASRLLSFQSGI